MSKHKKEQLVVETVIELIKELSIEEIVSQLIFLHIRQVTGGLSDAEFVAYSIIGQKVISLINENKAKQHSQTVSSFHVRFTGKQNDFKNRHLAIMLEALSSDYFIDVFDRQTVAALIEQDEKMLCNIMSEHLPASIGNMLIILLQGDVDTDVAKIEQLIQLLLERRMGEIAFSQTDTIKLQEKNPWQHILDDKETQINHIVVSYLNNSEDMLLDIDLINQLVFLLGMLKQVQIENNKVKAANKKAANKKIFDEIHKKIPKPQEVYDIDPEAILGTQTKPKSKQDIQDIDAEVADSTPTDDQHDQDKALDFQNAVKSNNDIKPSKAQKAFGSLLAKNPIKKDLFLTAKKKAERQALELLKQRLAGVKDHYLLKGLLDNKQPDTSDFVKNRIPGESRRVNDINTIEAILSADLHTNSHIDPNKLYYSFKDVGAGLAITLNWESKI